MQPLKRSEPMAMAWDVVQGNTTFEQISDWPRVLRDTAITIVLTDSLPARQRSRAVRILSDIDDPIATETCERVLETSASSLMRQAAISSRRTSTLLLRRVAYDVSYVVRTKALRALPPETPIADLRIAADDPHWRVRHELIAIVERRGLHASIDDWTRTDREHGFVEYVQWRHARLNLPENAATESGMFDWDSDPAVLLAELKYASRENWFEQLPYLIHHSAEKVRRWAVGQLLEFGTEPLCRKAIELATDPRDPGWTTAESLVRRLDEKRRPDWKPVEPLISEWSPEHPAVRRCGNPADETCWFVLQQHLRQHQMTPEQILPPPSTRVRETPPAPIQLSDRDTQGKRLAVSGHYLLPTEQFAVAFDAGIDSFFWESNYGTFNRFVKRLSVKNRSRLRMITGTFEAEPRLIRKDIDRALRLLHVEQLDVFLLFWSRSDRRFTEETLACLEDAKDCGKIKTYGLSTHQWQLARQQVEAGWDPVMVRHNLAHRGAEEVVFPVAKCQGTRIISFNTTCYGRLIEAGISACDCIRYSLHQPEVDLVLTAPATAEQLQENLAALDKPPLQAQQIVNWQKIGEQVYADNKAFRNGLQSR